MRNRRRKSKRRRRKRRRRRRGRRKRPIGNLDRGQGRGLMQVT